MECCSGSAFDDTDSFQRGELFEGAAEGVGGVGEFLEPGAEGFKA
jgi:hypothetical protein